MSRVSTTAVTAIACVALAVPEAASAKDEAATAAAIGNPTPLTVNLPAESEWTDCATEGARCEFTGTQQVRYGADGRFILPRTFTDGVACENAVFGDPAPGVVKQCQVTGLSQMKDEAATAAAIGDPTPLKVNLPAESDHACVATGSSTGAAPQAPTVTRRRGARDRRELRDDGSLGEPLRW